MKTKKTAPKRAGVTKRDRRWAQRFLRAVDGDLDALKAVAILLEKAALASNRRRRTR